MEPRKFKNSKNPAKGEVARKEPSVIVHKRSWAWPLATAVIFLGLIILVINIIGVILLSDRYGLHFQDGYSRNGWMMEHGTWGSWLEGQSRASGVVVSVSNNAFTIASNGGTKSITANGSTQYQGGSQVKINDSVIVYGQDSGNSLQASFIVINP